MTALSPTRRAEIEAILTRPRQVMRAGQWDTALAGQWDTDAAAAIHDLLAERRDHEQLLREAKALMDSAGKGDTITDYWRSRFIELAGRIGEQAGESRTMSEIERNAWRWPNFTPAEFTCMHCARCEMDPDFLDTLQRLRTELGFSLPISSGYRCPEHNARVSRTGPAGPHTTGRAADIRISGPRAFLLVQEAIAAGFLGIGVKQHGPHAARFVHLDLRAEMALWSYP